MNRKILLSYACCLLGLSAFAGAAVPEHWDVDLAAQPPQVFTLQRPRGETYDLEAVLNVRGKPFAPAITNACIYWQTNGMENLYWSAPASLSNNVLRATWLPSMDPGATTVRGYIGDPGHIYAAAFQFRFIASPGPTPNVLPLPTQVIDFAKVRVLNPPWPTSSGTDTNAVRDIAREEITAATNAIRKVDGAAKMLPKYLWSKDFYDSYPDDAQEYYRSRGNGKTDGGCSAVRSGGSLYRNFDFPFDDRAEFVVRMSAGPNRFASVGVAQVGTNLTEAIVTSGKPSRWYKALPGATVDGINENGVVAEINVVDGDPQTSGWHTNATSDAIHPLGAVRWSLDNGTSAWMVASNLAANIRFPQGWEQNFHFMIADETATYIVENGNCYRAGLYDLVKPVLTNFRVVGMQEGSGIERYNLLLGGANITNAWYTNAYRRETNPPWVSDLREVLAYTNEIFDAWATHDKEYFRGQLNGGKPWWQTCHTSVYDLTNRVLRVVVQEQDDWYTFAVPVTAPKIDAYTKAETDAKLAEKIGTNDFVAATNNLDQAVTFASQQSMTALIKADDAKSVAEGAAVIAEMAQSSADAAQSHSEETRAMIPDVRGLVPYTGATNDVNIGDNEFISYYGFRALGDQMSYTTARFACDRIVLYDLDGDYTDEYYFPWFIYYESADSACKFATVSQIEAATNGLAQTIPQKINAAVSANLNTYIDGETGVEYVGKFYGGSLYYVPTGNVYPPNN